MTQFNWILFISCKEHYITTITSCCCLFQSWTIAWHKNCSWNSKNLPCIADSTTMISWRPSNYTCFLLFCTEHTKSVIASTKFECTHSLKIITFKKNFCTKHFIQSFGCHHWCIVSRTFNSFWSCFHILKYWQINLCYFCFRDCFWFSVHFLWFWACFWSLISFCHYLL